MLLKRINFSSATTPRNYQDSIEAEVEKFIKEKMDAGLGLSALVPELILDGLKAVFIEQLAGSVEGAMDSLMTSVEDSLDFKAIVEERISSFDTAKLESIVYSIATKELKTIEYFGALLGFVVGLGQVALILLFY